MKKFNPFAHYLLKFGAAFSLLYFGTLGVIGLSTPENSYNKFVADYLNFVDPLRSFLLSGAKAITSLFGYNSFIKDKYTLELAGGGGVRMVYSCIGYGVLSFWAAFIFANNGSWKRKMFWITGGCAALCIINMCRLALVILASSKQWSFPFGWDHHTWFNICCYAFIFAMIYLYDRTSRHQQKTDIASTRTIKQTANPKISP